MQKTFCPSCGAKLEYSLNKPNFCSSCGEPLNSINTSQSSRIKKLPAENVAEDPDSTSYAHVPDVRKLEYDVEYSNPLRKIKMEDLRQDVEQRRRSR